MSQTLDIIKQSHKTILFEKFSDSTDQDAPSLQTIIDKYLSMDKFGSQEFYREIEQQLTVHSFDEFVHKFAPKVYEYVEFLNGIPHFRYTTDEIEAKKNGARHVAITDHTLFQMFEQLYSDRGASGLSNLDFPEDEIKKIFTPAAQMDDIYRMRKTVRSLSIDYDKAKQANQDAKPFALGLRKCRQEIRDKFKDSPLACLTLAIEEGSRKIQGLQTQIKQMEKQPDGVAPVLQIGRFGFDADGSMIVRPISTTAGLENAIDQKALDEDRAVRNTLALIKGDIDRIDSADDFTKELVISVYAPPQVGRSDTAADLPALREELASLEDRHQAYMQVYRQAQQAFITALTKSAQKLLDVLIFFDHATAKGGRFGKLPAGLIVTNCDAAWLIRDTTAKERFRQIMEKLGHASGDSKIWLGILPDVALDGTGNDMSNMSEEELMGDLDAPSTAEEVAQGEEFPFYKAKAFLNILDECGILTVFNFVPGPNNTFAGLSVEAVQELEKATQPLRGNRHAVLAYPNFTLMGEGFIDLAGQPITVRPVHISASYVAAGLIAASQQEDAIMTKVRKYLDKAREKDLKIALKEGSACVRVDLEDALIAPVLVTNINRELPFKWNADIIPAITRNRLGFVFCCDKKTDPLTNSPYDTTYVLQARSFENEDGKYQPLYRTLTLDYIDAYLNEYGRDSQEAIDRLKKDANEWVKDSGRSENKGKINLLLHEGEKIEDVTDGDNVSIEVNFNEGKASLKTAIKAKTNKGNEGK